MTYIGNGTDGQGNQVGLIIGLSVGGCAFLGIIFLVFTRRCKRGPTCPDHDLAQPVATSVDVDHESTVGNRNHREDRVDAEV